MARLVKFEGRTISVPDDATDEEVAAIIDSSSGAPAPAAPAAAPQQPEDFGTWLGNTLGYVGETAAGVPPDVDPEDWKYLTPEEQAVFLNGQ